MTTDIERAIYNYIAKQPNGCDNSAVYKKFDRWSRKKVARYLGSLGNRKLIRSIGHGRKVIDGVPIRLYTFFIARPWVPLSDAALRQRAYRENGRAGEGYTTTTALPSRAVVRVVRKARIPAITSPLDMLIRHRIASLPKAWAEV